MKSWERTLVKPSTPIRKVIETIERGEHQIALVVGANSKFLGTVTDGDIRRGILRGVRLEEAVQKVMHTAAVTASVSDAPDKILALMREKQVHQIPVLDKKKRVIRLEVLDQFVQTQARPNWVVLMAGGLGSRLKPLTDKTPKPLIHVGQKPILETILENFIEHGFRNFYISVFYKDRMIEKYFGNGRRWGVNIRYIHEDKKLGTAGALGLLKGKPVDPVIVMNADLLTKVNFTQLLSFHKENSAKATMCVREFDLQVPYGVVTIQNHHVRKMEEKPVQRFFVNAGIYVLDPGVLKMVPRKVSMDMPQLLEKVGKKHDPVAAFPIREYWLDIGHLDDLERANGDFSRIFKS